MLQIIWQLLTGEGLEAAGVTKGKLTNAMKWAVFFKEARK